VTVYPARVTLRFDGTRCGLLTPLYPMAVYCNPCYLVLHGIGCGVTGPFLLLRCPCRVPRFRSSFPRRAGTFSRGNWPPQSFSLAPSYMHHGKGVHRSCFVAHSNARAPGSALCLYPKSPASRTEAQTLLEVPLLAQCRLTGRHTSTYVDLLGISSRPVQ
jgi:hypothetical protein